MQHQINELELVDLAAEIGNAPFPTTMRDVLFGYGTTSAHLMMREPCIPGDGNDLELPVMLSLLQILDKAGYMIVKKK
jgi:hypothetical protein